MKSIMYHYIRNKNNLFPYSNILTKKEYLKQINKFSKDGIIKSYTELFKKNNKYLLTFDDGFKDHIYAAEILKKNDSIGIFFIPTSPLINNKILDVHKTHLILGKVKSVEALNELNNYLNKKKLNLFFNDKERIKFNNAYIEDDDELYKKQFKKIMNYYGNIELKEKVLNHLLKKFEIDVKTKDYYLTKKEIKHLISLGMIVGSHSENHILLSRLSYKDQFKEIKNSKILLEKITKKEINIFCYPYGGKKSYNQSTLKILKKLKYKLAYSVNSKDITLRDIKDKPYELPRYDCNMF